jgi:hypothetical protein
MIAYLMEKKFALKLKHSVLLNFVKNSLYKLKGINNLSEALR